MRFIISLCLCFGLFQSTAFSAVGCEQEQCVAIVDAGSSGSRLHLYSYDLDKSSNTPINIKDQYSKEIKPGLATLDINQETIDVYLSTLFSEQTGNNRPVYLYATAGMRLLPLPKQKQIHNLVQNWFARQSDWQLKSSKTITGSDEGLFAWLAVNSQLGTLQAGQKVGVLDMGGASVQIAFPVKNNFGLPEKYIKKIKVSGQEQTLFVASFLGLGQNEMMHQYLESATCYVQGYELPSNQKASGDAYACARKVMDLVNGVHKVNQVVQQPLYFNPVSQWYVLGGLDYLAKTPVMNLQNKFTSQELLSKGQSEVCKQEWSNLSTQYPSDGRLFSYCLTPAYYYALIVHGYGIMPQKKLNTLHTDHTADWTVGAVLAQPTS